jgi:hypothetical protein
MYEKTHFWHHVKCPLLLSDFHQNWNVSKSSLKMPNTKLNENPFSGAQVVACRQADIVKLKSAFLLFFLTNAPGRINT